MIHTMKSELFTPKEKQKEEERNYMRSDHFCALDDVCIIHLVCYVHLTIFARN